MSNVIKLRLETDPTIARGNDDPAVRALELMAATREEVGRAIFSSELMVQHARLIVVRIVDVGTRKRFEAELNSIEQALESARTIGRLV